MGVEAPVSRHRKNNLKLYIVVCIVLAIWFGYDGYLNENFIQKHSVDTEADSILAFNQWSAPFLVGVAVLLVAYFLAVGKRRIVAEENELVLNNKQQIAYDSIERINKTHFQTRGFFVITYKTGDGGEVNLKLSDRNHDNLSALLDVLVAKIS